MKNKNSIVKLLKNEKSKDMAFKIKLKKINRHDLSHEVSVETFKTKSQTNTGVCMKLTIHMYIPTLAIFKNLRLLIKKKMSFQKRYILALMAKFKAILSLFKKSDTRELFH